MTKIAETSWGKEFVDHLCTATDYHFDSDGKLNSRTTDNTLTLQKL